MINLKNKSIIFTALLWLLAGSCFAQNNSDQAENLMASRHRLDFSVSYMESFVDNSLDASLAYTYNLTLKTNISATVNYLDSRLGKEGSAGFGDTSLAFSWAPTVDLSVAPWVPRKIGTGLGVVLPTGDASDGRSLDSTILVPFVGLVFPLKDTIFLYPTFTYLWSADKIITGEDVRIGVADLGAGWVSPQGFWITVYSAIVRDFVADDSHFNYQVSLGVPISKQWSGSVDYVDSDFFLPGSDSDFGEAIDKKFALSLHFNF